MPLFYHHNSGAAGGRDPEIAARLARVEQMVETTALGIERIGEGQRFTTRVLSEKKTVESWQRIASRSHQTM